MYSYLMISFNPLAFHAKSVPNCLNWWSTLVGFRSVRLFESSVLAGTNISTCPQRGSKFLMQLAVTLDGLPLVTLKT